MTNLVPDKSLMTKRQVFSQPTFRKKTLPQSRSLRDAASHRVSHCEILLRMHALNGILLAVITGDRQWAIDIGATTQTFLSGKTKYQAITSLRAACT